MAIDRWEAVVNRPHNLGPRVIRDCRGQRRGSGDTFGGNSARAGRAADGATTGPPQRAGCRLTEVSLGPVAPWSVPRQQTRQWMQVLRSCTGLARNAVDPLLLQHPLEGRRERLGRKPRVPRETCWLSTDGSPEGPTGPVIALRKAGGPSLGAMSAHQSESRWCHLPNSLRWWTVPTLHQV